jgi:hypothetical protein
MSNYDINDFALAPEKPNVLSGEVLEWVNNGWVVRGPNASELDFQWYKIRQRRDQLLLESDILVLRAYESAEPVPKPLIDYRQQLRDVTQQPDPFNIVWPKLNG